MAVELDNYRVVGRDDDGNKIVSLPFAGSDFKDNYHEIQFDNGDSMPMKDLLYFIADYVVQQKQNSRWNNIVITG